MTRGPLCSSCMRSVGLNEPIPPEFFERANIRKALEIYDFGSVFTAVRDRTGLSQTQLGMLLELSQSRISAVERGERRIGHVRVVARVASRLGIPPQLLGFPRHAGAGLTTREVNWVDRRDFLLLVTAATLGSNLHPELTRLGNLLPSHSSPIVRTRLGPADIEAIEAISSGFRRWDMANGGGLCQTAALAQVHRIRALENAARSENLRTRYWIAAAELAATAAWLAYDVEDHGTARKLWAYALDATRKGAEHPRSTDLAVTILLDMAHQSLHLWRSEMRENRRQEALAFAQLASATSSNRKYPVSTMTAGYISAVTAWCWAALGQGEPMRRAIGTAQDHYGAANADNTPPWASSVTAAELTAQQGHAYYLLSLTDAAVAPIAVEQLAEAIDGHVIEHARSRAIALPTLAGAHLQAGNYDTAAKTTTDAINAVTSTSSARCYTRLRDLDRVAARHDREPIVAELREEIRVAAPATI
ncbi:helix-turn-helix domain-containing protein [Nocardia asteroides]|uniref:helix-turn-helix domain-containing protein n=1 Tax=Nocardia asteroides TaxID=1824 RepID=UPI001E4BE493|nr:helix-turn-helix transcriptional regulator [Nocardia asteroides]UGT64507.1 helix-turn-helix domain-containing protein [Nocardia asteroides]